MDTARVETEFRDLAARIPADAQTTVRQDHVQAKTRNTESFGGCPRCGKPLKIDPQTQQAASSNALSREVSGLYICDDCGSDEALRAFADLPLPLEEWEQTKIIDSVLK